MIGRPNGSFTGREKTLREVEQSPITVAERMNRAGSPKLEHKLTWLFASALAALRSSGYDGSSPSAGAASKIDDLVVIHPR
jgi:hypothetical protein